MGALYKAYLKHRKNAACDVNTKTVMFEHEGNTYRVITTQKRANRLSSIRCENGIVVWVQRPLFHLRYSDCRRGWVLARMPVAIDKACVTLFVIKGKPRSILGLDEGVFRSANSFDSAYINLMSEKRFRMLL